MPEGDTIHKLAVAMRPHLVGRQVAALSLRDRGEVRSLRGADIEAIDVLGKHMVIRFAGDDKSALLTLNSQFGSGEFGAEEPAPA